MVGGMGAEERDEVGRLPGDGWDLKVGPGRVRWNDGVVERDEGDGWHGDDQGPNGITMKG